MITRLKKVLFLCTGNSCRSQMAEAVVNACLDGHWLAVSAGTIPAGYVHPKAIAVLKEIGIDHSGKSKLADDFRDWDFDLVVTVCDSAAAECPVWLGIGRRVNHSFPDPAEAAGTEEEIMDAFRQARDNIVKQIPALLEKYQN